VSTCKHASEDDLRLDGHHQTLTLKVWTVAVYSQQLPTLAPEKITHQQTDHRQYHTKLAANVLGDGCMLGQRVEDGLDKHIMARVQ
jgi:hypothetical protein